MILNSLGLLRKPLASLALLTAAVSTTAPAISGEKDLVSLANPQQGMDSSPGFSHGNTYPAIALPFPMNTWVPYNIAFLDASAKPKLQKDQPTGDQEKQIGGGQ